MLARPLRYTEGMESVRPVARKAKGSHAVDAPGWFDPRQAIGETSIICLVCGRAFRQLTNTHLKSHGLDTPGYKRQFGYNRGRPMMSRALLRVYAARAVERKLAFIIRRRPVLERPELRARKTINELIWATPR